MRLVTVKVHGTCLCGKEVRFYLDSEPEELGECLERQHQECTLENGPEFSRATCTASYEPHLSAKEPKKKPRYCGGPRYVLPGRELYLCVLRIMKRQQGKPIFIDDFLREEDVLSCYTPNHFMRCCNPPNIRRARKSIMSAIGYLRRKGHVIESTKEFGQIAYSWHGK